MTLKKMLLLASMALTALAFAAPAAQAAPFWYTDPGDVKVGDVNNQDHVHLTGSISYTTGGFQSGPCAVTANITIWNSATMGEGTVTDFNAFGPCPTTASAAGCNVEAVTTTTEDDEVEGEPVPTGWDVTAIGTDEVEIGNGSDGPVTFTDRKSVV